MTCVSFTTAFVLAALALPAAGGQSSADTKGTIPLIQMENVPLRDAVRNLARQMGTNYILDPRLSGAWVGPDGKSGREPSVNVRWENLSAEQALTALLKQHGLEMVGSPATSTARIAFTNQAVKPIPASQVGHDTNAIIPLVVMDSTPLEKAIMMLAAQGHLNLSLDPAMAVPPSGGSTRTVSNSDVSVRWEKVTARQALAALLDNYDLVLIEDPATSVARVTAKAQPQSRTP